MLNKINSLESYLSKTSSDMANSVFDCPFCDRQHIIPFGKIKVGYNLIEEIPSLLCDILGHSPKKSLLLFDNVIETLVKDHVLSKLNRSGLCIVPIGLGEKGILLESDSKLGDQVADTIDSEIEIILGVGSGVIADLTKWISTRSKKPFILIGTAPSMNAHASITSTMTIDGVKTSRLLNPADAIIFDVDILSEAPVEMLLAGMGDLIARSICNADWKLSQVVRNTYFCPLPYQLTAKNEKEFLDKAEWIVSREREAIYGLSEAILISGISMTMLNGQTSPSSGTEHVFSHYWDLQVELEGAQKNLHGTQVAVGTVLSMALFDFMRDLDIGQINLKELTQKRPQLEQLFSENNQKFGNKAYLFNEVVKKKYIPDEQFKEYLESILSSWDEMWEAINPYIAEKEMITKPLERAGFHFSLDTIGRTDQQAIDSMIYGNRYRMRYTMLDLAWELGVLPDAAHIILHRSGIT
jgi:glycerol-1-phosphate dehydrogenase [NAD(P)+]